MRLCSGRLVAGVDEAVVLVREAAFAGVEYLYGGARHRPHMEVAGRFLFEDAYWLVFA